MTSESGHRLLANGGVPSLCSVKVGKSSSANSFFDSSLEVLDVLVQDFDLAITCTEISRLLFLVFGFEVKSLQIILLLTEFLNIFPTLIYLAFLVFVKYERNYVCRFDVKCRMSIIGQL